MALTRSAVGPNKLDMDPQRRGTGTVTSCCFYFDVAIFSLAPLESWRSGRSWEGHDMFPVNIRLAVHALSRRSSKMRYVCGCKTDARFLVFAIPYNRTLIAMLRCLIKYYAMDLLSENELLAGILLHGVRANQPTSQFNSSHLARCLRSPASLNNYPAYWSASKGPPVARLTEPVSSYRSGRAFDFIWFPT